MRLKDFLNAGNIHDFPIGKGKSLSIGNEKFAVFRETYGHFYIFIEQVNDQIGPLFQGIIDQGKIKLRNGHSVDLHTGRLDESEEVIPSVTPWLENGFILFNCPSAQNRITQHLD